MDVSAGAFLLTCDKIASLLVRIRNGLKFVYFWTFTFPDVITVKEASGRWNKFANHLRRCYPNVPFIRVFELHDTHGLHVHLILPFRLDVRDIRRRANKCGFGRIHAKVIPAEAGFRYMAKYLLKGRRERVKCLKGVRLWGVINFPEHTLCKNVVTTNFCSSIYKRSMKYSCPVLVRFLEERDFGLLAAMPVAGGRERFYWLTLFCQAHYSAFYWYVSVKCSRLEQAGYSIIALD